MALAPKLLSGETLGQMQLRQSSMNWASPARLSHFVNLLGNKAATA
jgi:hypothetical protein